MSTGMDAAMQKGDILEPKEEGRLGANPPHFPAWVRFWFWTSIAIAAAVVFRRAVALLSLPSRNAPPQVAQLDAAFASHAALTWAHILLALGFVSLLLFLFWRRTQDVRWLKRTFLILGGMVGVTAYAMSLNAVGGWLERSAVLVFNTLFLIALIQAFLWDRQGDVIQQRRWTIRAIAILLGIATTRPVMGVFFATSALTHLAPAQFFGAAFWIGFSINTLGIELWLRSSAAAEWIRR